MAAVKVTGVHLVPVTASRQLESFDAVAAFRQISGDGQGFILDGHSPQPGADRFVYVGAGDCERLETGPGTEIGDVNPADVLRVRLDSRQMRPARGRENRGRFSGAVGYFGYESIRHFEPSVGELPADPRGLPEAAFFLPEQLVVYDRLERILTSVVLIAADVDESAKEQARLVAVGLLDAAVAKQNEFGSQIESRSSVNSQRHEASDIVETDATAKTRYETMVQESRNEIERGELIQVVLSQRAVRRTDASPLDVYTALSALNPSPYMFMLNFGDFSVVGSSPELMVRSREREVSMHPVAGTRPRGTSTEEDVAFEAQLLTSEKERAEHVMLVDLARNDLGRVSEPGSVEVDSFMATERYSHVMHLVSRVKGRLRADTDGIDAFVAGFPLGTLTGAPRLRSVELIAELEGEGRGPYCGGVGWFDASGDADTGTVIRCVVMKDGVAHIQGGGGIVFDSEPEREYLESVQKMAAQFEAIEMAESKRRGARV